MRYSNPADVVAEDLDGGPSNWPKAALRHVREVFNGATSMSEERWAWIGAIAGVIFVLALLFGRLMIPNPPAIDAGATVLITYFSTYAGVLLASGLIGTAGAVVFLVFIGVVHHRHERLKNSASGSVLL